MTTPKANVLRTLLQALVAVCVAIPSALALVPIPSKYDAAVAFTIGLAGAIVVLVTALQNAIEARAGVALFRNPTPTSVTGSWGTLTEPPTDAPTSEAEPRGPP